jgi:serine/threonine protein kinase
MDLTYTSLGGSSTGCVEFFGISTFSDSVDDASSSQTGFSLAGRNLVLVSEYATEGSIREFLSKRLPDLTYEESWVLIVDMLSNVANGLYSLHRHGVIHR